MQLVLSNNRVLAHGENFISMGGTVINTETNKVYQNATVAECDGCPSDINKVGYEYHAGRFVPCAPFGVGPGNVAVYCDECKTPRDSGKSIDDFYGMSSYLAFVASQDSDTIDAAFGKNNEDMVRGVGVGLAMYGWFKGLDKTVHPFTHLRKMSTLNDMSLDIYNEIICDDNFYLYDIINASSYASDKVFDSFNVDWSTPSGDPSSSSEEHTTIKQITITDANLLGPFVVQGSFKGVANVNDGIIYLNDMEVASYDYSKDGKSKSFRALKNWSDYNITKAGTYDIKVLFTEGWNTNDTSGTFTIQCAKEY